MTGRLASITPEPTLEEAVAIAAALEVMRPVVVAAPSESEPSRWRFSGRWWSKPVPTRRSRP
ncbi:MAG TPA: hypothetical protein VIY72_10880 [Acidimicrobiales bacterium]